MRAGTDLVAGNVELTRTKTQILEVAPERPGWGVKQIPSMRVAVDGLQRQVEAVDGAPGDRARLVEDVALGRREPEHRDERLALVEPREVLEPSRVLRCEQLVDLPERRSG